MVSPKQCLSKETKEIIVKLHQNSKTGNCSGKIKTKSVTRKELVTFLCYWYLLIFMSPYLFRLKSAYFYYTSCQVYTVTTYITNCTPSCTQILPLACSSFSCQPFQSQYYQWSFFPDRIGIRCQRVFKRILFLLHFQSGFMQLHKKKHPLPVTLTLPLACFSFPK